MIPSHLSPWRPPELAAAQEPSTPGPAARPAPEGLSPRRPTPGDSPPARQPRHALAILQPQAVADAAAQARARSDPERTGAAWWNLPEDSNPHGDAAWWAATVARLRAEEHAGPRAQAALATPPRERPLPESDDDSEDDDGLRILCDTSPHAGDGSAGIGPERTQALARHADDIAALEDFRLALELKENNHEALGRSVWDLHDTARHFHADWRATGNTESLAKAQGLDIKHKALEGLCALKQQHRGWSRLNPRTYEPVIRALRGALDLCRTPEPAAVFPIRGFDAPLQEVERLMQETLERVERREWEVRLPDDPDAEQVRSRRIQAWKFHGRAVEACHGPQDWDAMQEVLVERKVESFAQAQACKLPPRLCVTALCAQQPWQRPAARADMAAMLRPVMEPLAWALARQVHSEIVPAGRPPRAWRAAQAAEFQRRLQTFTATLAGQVHSRTTGIPPGPRGRITGQEAALRHELWTFASDLARTAHDQLVRAQDGPEARQEAMLRSALQALADPPARARERAALHRKLMQACRTLGGLAAELRTALQGPQVRTAAPQTMPLADVPAPRLEPACPQLAVPPMQAPDAGMASAPPGPPAAVEAASAQDPAPAPPPQGQARPVPAEVPVHDLKQALQAQQVADSAPGQPRCPAVIRATVSPPRPGTDRSPALESAPTPRDPSPAKAEPRPDPVREAARLQQERITALQAALAPLLAEAQRCVAAAQACGATGSATEPAWARHAREFTAWQAAVQAHDAHAAQATSEAEAMFGPAGLQPDAVRSLREKAAQAARDALAQATKAALRAWESFSEACDATLVQHGRPDEALAAGGRELYAQWNSSPLRERMRALAARMEQYRAFEIAGTVTTHGTETALADAADVVDQAERLRTAMDITDRALRDARGRQAGRLKAFRGFCAGQREALLGRAVDLEVWDMLAVHAVRSGEMAPALQRSHDVSLLYDTLLTDDPLPDEDAATPHPRPGPSEASPAGTGATAADQSLVESARQAAQGAAGQRERAITLPEDTPSLALSEHQALLAMLRQGELTARTAEAVISRFHSLPGELEAARPTRRPDLVQGHADAMKQLAGTLRDHVVAMGHALRKPLTQDMFNHLAYSAALLRADLRLAERTLASLRTLQHLLSLRVTANQERRRILQGRHDLTAGPALPWTGHGEFASRLDQARESALKQVEADRAQIGDQAWTATELTHIEAGLRRLKHRVAYEEAVIRAKLLLARAERARDAASGHLRLPAFIPALQESVTAHTQALMRVNQESKAIGPAAGRSQAHEARRTISEGLQRQLLTLQVTLRNELAEAQPPSPTALGPVASPAQQEAVRQHLRRIDALRAELGPSLEAAVRRSRALITDCHRLLTGDPLPDRQAAGPAHPAGSQELPEDQALIRQARAAVKRAGKLRQPAASLPPDAQPPLVHEHHAGRVILRQIELRAQTAAAVMSGVHDASHSLQAAGPARRPAIAQRHAHTLAQLAVDLDQALHDLYEVTAAHPAAMDLLGACHLRLCADRRLARRSAMSWQVLDRLLSLRVAADQVRRRFERGDLAGLDGPEVQGLPHQEVLDSMRPQWDGLHQDLDEVRGVIEPSAWVDEYRELTASQVHLVARVESERVMIQAGLLLAWAEGALRPASGASQAPEAIAAFKRLVDQHLPVLEQVNQEVQTLQPLSAGDGGPHDVQLAANRQVEARLRDLQEQLSGMQPVRRRLRGRARGE